jgi:diguanylate cyclase (GGDEF)-like protein
VFVVHSEIVESAIQTQLLRLSPTTPLIMAITAMAEAQTSCVVVVEQEQLVGIFTQRDIVRIVASDLVLAALTLADVMVREVVTLSLAEVHDIFTIAQRFSQYQIRHLPVVDAQNQVIGIITPQTVRHLLKPEHLLRAIRVGDVMTQTVIQGALEDSILTLAQQMAAHRVSCVVIVDQHQPVGIITEHDIVQFKCLGLAFAQIPADRVMSTPLVTIQPQDSLWQAHRTMQQLRVRRLVITHPTGELAGLVTQTQVLQVLDSQEFNQVMAHIRATVEQQTDELRQRNNLLQAANAELAHLANIDELTQLPNRRRFNASFQMEWQRLARLQAPLSLIMCDIDNFKVFNDTYGHPAGDDCLVRIAQLLQQITRKAMDLVVRYGGEEFVIVLPHTDGRGAERVARNILSAVEALRIPHQASPAMGYVTVSLGVATIVPTTEGSPIRLLEVADQLLYQSKQQGRNTYRARVLESSAAAIEP